MAKREPDGCVTLHEANQKYMADNRETEKMMGGAQRAAHRAVDIAFGRVGVKGPYREQKSLRGVPPAAPTEQP